MHKRLLTTAAWVTLALSADVSAQERVREPIDVERFKPAVTYDGFVITEGTDVRYPLPDGDPFELAGYLNYQLNSLVVVGPEDNIVDKFVAHRVGGDLIASMTLFEGFAVGIDVPFFLLQYGDADPNWGGLGDVRIVPKYRILDDREIVGLAVLGELRVPTHTDEEFSGGARMVTFWPRLALDHRFRFGLRFGVNAGVAIRKDTQFENVTATHEFTYSGAVAYRFGGLEGPAEIGLDVAGATGLKSIDYEELPLEGFIYGAVFPTSCLTVQFGPSAGIVPGYGIPTFRAFAGIRYAPSENDRDGDGIPDEADRCPDVPEDRDGYMDRDGCPEDDDTRDDDQDGIPNVDDACPGQKETINGIEDEDGCPDKGAAKVVREKGKLLVLENIEFATSSAAIRPSSYGVLNQVALMMKANPDIKMLRIEGHTDSRGSRDMNMKLSQARAESVRNYLIGRGISPDRLTAQGFGPDRPVVTPEKTEEDMQKNRRSEFIIER
jgi:outer membrane protein OmpA-like peptidoglycan-associated protein